MPYIPNIQRGKLWCACCLTLAILNHRSWFSSGFTEIRSKSVDFSHIRNFAPLCEWKYICAKYALHKIAIFCRPYLLPLKLALIVLVVLTRHKTPIKVNIHAACFILHLIAAFIINSLSFIKLSYALILSSILIDFSCLVSVLYCNSLSFRIAVDEILNGDELQIAKVWFLDFNIYLIACCDCIIFMKICT